MRRMGLLIVLAFGATLLRPLTAEAAPGDLDPTFGSGGTVTVSMGLNTADYANAVVVQPDGRIVVGGQAGSVFALARFTTAGTLDGTFGSAGKRFTTVGDQAAIRSVSLQPDGKVVAAGYSSSSGTSMFTTMRYTSAGNLDSTFGSGGIVRTAVGPGVSSASAVAVQSDGKIVVSGTATVSQQTGFAVVRYASNGTLDTTFDGDGVATTAFAKGGRATAMTLQTDGKILVVGVVTGSSAPQLAIARYLTTGAPDPQFNFTGVVEAGDNTNVVAGGGSSITVAPDGSIFAGGSDRDDAALWKLRADGMADPSFGNEGEVLTDLGGNADVIDSLALQPDGKIVAGGARVFEDPSSSFVRAAALRFLSNGVGDGTFGSGGRVYTTDDASPNVALQADGKIVTAGDRSGDFHISRYLSGMPRLSIADAGGYEGDSGSPVSNFRVTLSDYSASSYVTVHYATVSGSAQTWYDYQPQEGDLTFNPGETSKTISVKVVGDTVREPDETYTVVLSNPSGASVTRATAYGTITNDDVPSISPLPSSTSPGGKISISGSKFAANAGIQLTFDGTNAGAATTNSVGSFSASIAVPRTASPGAHIVLGTENGSGFGASAPVTVEWSWPQFRGGAAHRGVSAAENVLSSSSVSGLEPLWSHLTASGAADGSPIDVGLDRLFVSSSSGKVEALDPSTGAVAWTGTTGGSVGAPAMNGNKDAFVASTDGRIYLFRDPSCANPCSPQAKTATVGAFNSSPTVDASSVFAGSSDGKLYAYGTSFGSCPGQVCSPLWSSSALGGPANTSPAVANGVVYIAAAISLFAFDEAGVTNCSGTPKVCSPLWSGPIGAAAASSPAVSGGRVVVGSTNGNVYAFDADGIANCSGSTCSPLWTATTGGAVKSSPAIAGGVVYVGSDDGKLYGLNATNGGVKWSVATGGAVQSSPAIANDVVFVGSNMGTLAAYATTNGATLWSVSLGGNITASPAIANGAVYIGTPSGRVRAFALPSA